MLTQEEWEAFVAAVALADCEWEDRDEDSRAALDRAYDKIRQAVGR